MTETAGAPEPIQKNNAIASLQLKTIIDSTMAVEMRLITKRFVSTTALANVNLSLKSGEIHALLGENGAGKSTLMHILAGEMGMTSGEIVISGTPTTITSPRHARKLGIAMVHQHFMLAPALTVAENLALDADAPVGLDLMRSWIRFSARKAAAPSLELARKLGWNLNPDAIVSNLSVGQQQRIEIVKALATNARIIIFDEPTAVLNGDEIEDLFGVLRRLRGENKSIVLIAHKLSEIMAVADRVTVLRKGHLVSTQSIKDTSSAELAVMMVGNVSEINQMQTEDVPVLTSGIDANSELVCKASGLTILGERGEVAISGLDLEVYAGEIFGIGGVDGNGQAELAEVLAGLRRPDSGTLDVRSPRTGYIPQDRRRSGLALSMSVSDNLLFEAAQQAEFRHGPILRSGSLRALASSMIREYDIRTPGPKVPASILSGGNQQKIVVARALRSKPAWVVAMNPTRGLDIGAARFVHNQLRKARDRGAAVLVISTDLDELAALADRSAILAGGVLSPYNSCDVSAADIGLLLGGVTTAHAESRAAMQ